jgi:hypothetical protein
VDGNAPRDLGLGAIEIDGTWLRATKPVELDSKPLVILLAGVVVVAGLALWVVLLRRGLKSARQRSGRW